ncbi:MAG: LysR family transcriptional regulator [Pseudomonadota bacterium]
MDNWNEIRTAYELLRNGTISATARALGIHRATVIRHVDAMEAQLGGKLFIRSAKGYTATELGEHLLDVATNANESFRKFAARAQLGEAGLSGDIVITADGPALILLLPTIRAFQKQHPNITVRFIADRRILRLEKGEAHIAIRIGNKPKDPDNVVRHLRLIEFAVCCSDEYVASHGMPDKADIFTRHRWVLADDDGYLPPFYSAIKKRIPQANLAFVSNDPIGTFRAVEAGIGLGFIPIERLERLPGLHPVMERDPSWEASFWLVTHTDVHRSAKVQKFLEFLKKNPVEEVTY